MKKLLVHQILTIMRYVYRHSNYQINNVLLTNNYVRNQYWISIGSVFDQYLISIGSV